MMGGANCHAGEFQQSLAFSEKAIELDDKVNCTHKAPWAAADPAIVARDYVEMASPADGPFRAVLGDLRTKHGDRLGARAPVLHRLGERVSRVRAARLRSLR